ncbi:MAG: response regulator, partial [Rickettsiales bacterium]|nr:response regulator [Rickettsiales bacterium]
MHQNRILVVDDDRRLRQLLEEFLSSRGFRICTAENAMEARRMLEETNYALMVVDPMMPGENGLELVENLRKKHVATPILMLTAL